MSLEIAPDAALIVIDVQREFEHPRFGVRDNPDAEANIDLLVKEWGAAGRPIVRVRHEEEPGGPFGPDTPGYAFKPVVADLAADLEVTKDVHSAFGGTPSLHDWLRGRDIDQIVICGIQTNRCCETTARVGCDLGYEVVFAVDAMHTFDKAGPDGVVLTGAQLTAATAASLHGYFATVVRTADLVA